MGAPQGNSPEERHGRMDASPPVERYCIGCSYALMGLPQNRCPECGREFDPSDGSTFHDHPPDVVERSLADSIGSLERLAWWIFAPLLLLAIFTSATGDFRAARALMMPFGIYLMLAGVFVIFGVAGLGHISKVRVARVIVMTLTVLSLFGQWPLSMTFSWSRGQLDQLAAQACAGQLPATPVRAGVFSIRKIEVRGNLVCLWTDADPSGPKGLVKCTPGEAHATFNLKTTMPLSNDWQWVEED